MNKIFNDIKNNNNKNKEIMSILNEGNNLCENLLSIIILKENFEKGEYFKGLFDYIFFKEIFIIHNNEEKEDNFGIYEKYKNFNDGLYNFNANNYLYIYETVKINKTNSIWNNYIINTYTNKKLNIIYDTLDSL